MLLQKMPAPSCKQGSQNKDNSFLHCCFSRPDYKQGSQNKDFSYAANSNLFGQVV